MRRGPGGVPRVDGVFDLVGVGFGPSNLALAVCARERDPRRSCLFLERHESFRWHRGMMIDGARMQVSFLKDLVSLRNLASRYTFLQYTKARGRLEEFVNLNEFRPTRIEFEDYLRWVAADFASQVRYGKVVREVAPAEDGGGALFRISYEDAGTGEWGSVLARNVVYAAGGRPRLPHGIDESDRVVHSSRFLPAFPERFPGRERPWRFAVAGAGQSAGEIVDYLLERYEAAEIHLAVSGYGLRPTDNSPFVNEQFSSASVARFHELDPAARAELNAELAGSNYGVVREDLIERIYRATYLDRVKGRQRLVVHAGTRLRSVREDADGLVALLEDRHTAAGEQVRCDGVVLATGYERSPDPDVFAGLLPHMERDATGGLVLSRSHRVSLEEADEAGLYLPGHAESAFGLGDSLLSLLAFRSQAIFDDVCERIDASDAARGDVRPQPGRAYPPPVYLEHDVFKLHKVMEDFRFATVVSAAGDDEPAATQIPLVLDAARGPRGMLLGHFDRANPHVRAVDGRRVIVLFNGPNAYISPGWLESDQLPTWNSMTVRVTGRARLVGGRDAIVPILCRIAEVGDPSRPLSPDDPRIDKLIGGIVGVEIEIEEIVGRFKLSQEHDDNDRRNAALALSHRSERGERDLIEYVVGLPLDCPGGGDGHPHAAAEDVELGAGALIGGGGT